MDPLFMLADQHSKAALPGVAYSALPDAPVLPYVPRRHRMRRLAATIRDLGGHGTRPTSSRPAHAPVRIIGWRE
jgi:hypothetical protein